LLAAEKRKLEENLFHLRIVEKLSCRRRFGINNT